MGWGKAHDDDQTLGSCQYHYFEGYDITGGGKEFRGWCLWVETWSKKSFYYYHELKAKNNEEIKIIKIRTRKKQINEEKTGNGCI